MRCPKCQCEIHDTWTPAAGTHHEVKCACGADLQWDQPVAEGARPGIIRTGPPQVCQHSERREGARVPLDSN